MGTKNFYTVKLKSKRQLTDTIWEFKFEKPANFKHLAGQFVQFQIPSENSFVLRSYSISSAPAADDLEFCIKFVPDGKASKLLSELNKGEELNVSEPSGLFTCADAAARRYLVATGTGIAPLMAMIEDKKSHVGEIDLLFGVGTESDLFWLDRFESAKARSNKFNFRITLSRGSENWTGLRGRVTEQLKIDLNRHYYLCGSREMVMDVRNLLLKNGVNTKNVHFEIF